MRKAINSNLSLFMVIIIGQQICGPIDDNFFRVDVAMAAKTGGGSGNGDDSFGDSDCCENYCDCCCCCRCEDCCCVVM